MRGYFLCRVVSGAVFGVILALLSDPIRAYLGAYGDYLPDAVLIALYFLAFPIAAILLDGLGYWVRGKRPYSGLTLFYGVEFIAWIAAYEAIKMLA